MGFWVYPKPGRRTPSKQWMAELMQAQSAGKEPEDVSKLRLDAGVIRQEIALEPAGAYPGHAGWIDGRWKLHGVTDDAGGSVRYELYDLESDPGEEVNLADGQQARVTAMQAALRAWQRSVVSSLNGADYASQPPDLR
jgi:arylsulfatase A-like enzyme